MFKTQVKNLKLVGKGTFSKCYQETEDTVLLITCDPLKEGQALFSNYDSLIPKIERIDYDCDNNGINWFLLRMQNYGKTDNGIYQKLDNHNKKLFMLLKGIYKKYPIGYSAIFKAFDNLPIDFQEEKEIIQNFIGDVCNCLHNVENLRFEFSPRNLRQVNGKLIMLDCFFSIQALRDTQKRRVA